MLYELQVISKHPEFQDQNLKKYKLNNEDVVGAWKDEPFEVVFKNNSYSKIQVKLSIDGTDVLTGELADTAVTSKMWVVSPRSELRLKAWPETTEGGAQFVFTNPDNSVAAHTHGNTTSSGIIAAAVYTESYTPNFYGTVLGTWTDHGTKSFSSSGIVRGVGTYEYSPTLCDASYSNNTINTGSYSLESTASIGAGQRVEQKVSTAQGLRVAKLSEVIRLKYVWWTDLAPQLEENWNKVSASGFPGDNKPLMSLGSTPRIGEPVLPKFTRV